MQKKRQIKKYHIGIILVIILIISLVSLLGLGFFAQQDIAGQAINREMKKTDCLKQKMKVYKKTNQGTLNTANFYDDILVIEDSAKLIDGKPFTFQFAIENRIPALDLVKDLSLLEELGFEENVIKKIGGEVDIVIQKTSPFPITPKAYDPDEDGHANGFMQPSAYFTTVLETTLPPCPVPDPPNDIDEALINDLIKCQPITKTVFDQTINQLQINDIGLTKLKIQACDDAGKCDYQIVSILVIP